MKNNAIKCQEGKVGDTNADNSWKEVCLVMFNLNGDHQSTTWVSSLFTAMTASDASPFLRCSSPVLSCGVMVSSAVGYSNTQKPSAWSHCGGHLAFTVHTKTNRESRWINKKETDSISISCLTLWVMLLRLPESTTESFAIINNQPWVRWFHWSEAQVDSLVFSSPTSLLKERIVWHAHSYCT